MDRISVGTETETREESDVWVPSSCSLCYGACSILAHRVDGVVVKLEGNPNSAYGKGRLCGKGVFFNELLELDWRHVSPANLNLNLDLCVKVKVTPAGDKG